MWVLKMDTSFNIQWQKCLGGTDGEDAYQIKQCSNSGLIIVGYTQSTNGDVTFNHGQYDGWAIKLSPLSNGISNYIDPITDFSCHLNNLMHITSVNFYEDKKESIQFNLLDITGKILFAKDFTTTTGFNKVDLEIPNLSNGIYMARMVTANGIVSKKVTVQ